MKIFSQESQNYLPLIVMLSLFSGMGLIAWFGIIPFQGFITEKADNIQEYYVSRENRERQIKQLPELQGQFENILSDEQTLDILLSESRIIDFVKTLERLAQETGTHVVIVAKDGAVIQEKKISQGAVEKTGTSGANDVEAKKKEEVSILDSVPYDRYLHVSVVVTGEYRNVISFLHKMESLPYGLDVIGLSIQKRDREEQQKKPLSPSNNPFSILSQEVLLPENAAFQNPTEQDGPTGSLEASFDTVVYLNKGE